MNIVKNPKIIFVFFFFLVWAFFMVLKSSDKDISFSVLAQRFGKQNFTSWKEGELRSGDKLVGDFTATENNFGIISININSDRVIDADKIMFRLKEKGSKNWYYESKYRVAKLRNSEFFPFGFPVIDNSQGKKYTFEIDIIRGEINNALYITPQYPVFAAHYKF